MGKLLTNYPFYRKKRSKRTTRDESNFILMNTDSFLKFEVVFSYNFRYLRYFKTKNYRDGRVNLLSSVFYVRLLLDRMFHCLIFKTKKLPRDESEIIISNFRALLDIISGISEFLFSKDTWVSVT